jgi:hypothetical protein
MKYHLPTERAPYVHTVHQDLSSILPGYATLNEDRLIALMSVSGVVDFFNNWVPLVPDTWENHDGTWLFEIQCPAPNEIRLRPVLDEVTFPEEPPIAILSPYLCSGFDIVFLNIQDIDNAGLLLQKVLQTLYFTHESISLEEAVVALRLVKQKLPHLTIGEITVNGMHILQKKLGEVLTGILGSDIRPLIFGRFSKILAVSLLDTLDKWETYANGSPSECIDQIHAVAVFANGCSVFLRAVEGWGAETYTPPDDLPADTQHATLRQDQVCHAHVTICREWLKLKYGDIVVDFRKRRRGGEALLKFLYEAHDAEPGRWILADALYKKCNIMASEKHPLKTLLPVPKKKQIDLLASTVFNSVFSFQKAPRSKNWEVRLNPKNTYSLSDYAL